MRMRDVARLAFGMIALLAAAIATAQAGTRHPVRNSAGAANAPLLHLQEVLESVVSHYPLLQIAVEEQALAAARLLSRQGAFDLSINAAGRSKPAGFYETHQGDLWLEQPLREFGSTIFGGYRIGNGDFAVWDGGDETNKGGEFRLGARVPLLRDRGIDSRRAELRKAEIEVDTVDPFVQERLIDFSRSAAFAYWDWVATGLRVGVARQLVELARQRQSQLTRRVERGALPAIDLTDNQRLIVEREVRLIAAERAFSIAAIELSLFLRDGEGEPLPPDENRLPVAFPEEERPDLARLDAYVERAFAQRPRLREITLQAERASVELSLAENRLLPDLSVSVAGSKDIGAAVQDPDNKGPTVFEAGIRFEVPLQRRQARGETAAATARMRQIDAQLRFARDRVAADVAGALVALEAAFDQVLAARQNLELAQELQRAEERILLLGTSNLINVNIRELQAFDAATTLIAAQADYFRALADYHAAVGEGGVAAAAPLPAPERNGG